MLIEERDKKMKRFFLLFMAVILSAFVLIGCGTSEQDAETITELQTMVDDLQNQVEEYSTLKTELDSANNSITELQSQMDALKTEKDEILAKLEMLYKIEPVDETMYTIADADIYDDLYGEALGKEPVGTIPAEQEIKVIGKSAVIDWYVIKTDNSDNLQMVSGSLLSTTKPQPQQPTSQPSSGNTNNTSTQQPSGETQQPSGGGQPSSGGNGGLETDDGAPAWGVGAYTPPGGDRSNFNPGLSKK